MQFRIHGQWRRGTMVHWAFAFFVQSIPPTQSLQTCEGAEGGATSDGDGIDESNVWGRLLSINKLFPSLNLTESEYSLGRGDKCSVSLASTTFRESKYFLAYSSTHLKIVRDLTKNHVYIQDLSSNGTFVNGEKIGKNKKRVLENNAEIALASKAHRVYVFIDPTAREDSSIPPVVREKYIVSKEIGRGAYGEVKLCFIRGKARFDPVGQIYLLGDHCPTLCSSARYLRPICNENHCEKAFHLDWCSGSHVQSTNPSRMFHLTSPDPSVHHSYLRCLWSAECSVHYPRISRRWRTVRSNCCSWAIRWENE